VGWEKTTLLEKAIERVGALPHADEAAWKQRFANTQDQLRQLASEALQEDPAYDRNAIEL
jgi:hypothetical protein